MKNNNDDYTGIKNNCSKNKSLTVLYNSFYKNYMSQINFPFKNGRISASCWRFPSHIVTHFLQPVNILYKLFVFSQVLSEI